MLATWDFGLLLILAIGAGYGFIFRRGQIVVLFVSSYISFVLVQELGDKAINILEKSFKISNYSVFAAVVAKLVLFLIAMILLAIWAEYLAASSGKRGILNLIFSVIYGFLFGTMLLAIASIFLTPELEIQILALSRLSFYIIQYRALWLLAPAGLMLVSGFAMARKEKNG